MADLNRTTTYRVQCDDHSSWELSFEVGDKNFYIGLHFNGKLYATHTATISISDFQKMLTDLGIGPK